MPGLVLNQPRVACVSLFKVNFKTSFSLWSVSLLLGCNPRMQSLCLQHRGTRTGWSGVDAAMGEALERGRVGVVSYSWYLPDRWFSHHRVRGRLFSKSSCEGQRKRGGPGTGQVQNTRIRTLSQCRVLRSCDCPRAMPPQPNRLLPWGSVSFVV